VTPVGMGWANLVTLARGAMTVVLWVLLAVASPDPTAATWWTALVLFLVAALSDMVDGMLARRFGEVSAFGRIADPLIDKLLVLGTMIVMLGVPSLHAMLPAWMVAAMLAREMVVTSLRGAVEGMGIPFGAVASGKGKMVLQCAAVGALLLAGAGSRAMSGGIDALSFLPGGSARWNVAHLLVWAATIVTVWSGLTYVRRAAALLRGR
jgi:CDP-diacylglycerol--glycerol-3-phosphate 3-phosphatidyltransferase